MQLFVSTTALLKVDILVRYWYLSVLLIGNGVSEQLKVQTNRNTAGG